MPMMSLPDFLIASGSSAAAAASTPAAFEAAGAVSEGAGVELSTQPVRLIVVAAASAIASSAYLVRIVVFLTVVE